jgi:hypothetical protein
VNRKSGKAAELLNFSTADGGDVIQWTDLNGMNQQRSIADIVGGYHKLVNINSIRRPSLQAAYFFTQHK